MPSTSEIAAWVSNHFARHQQHVAEALAGPKRETWFSTECFVALSHAAQPDPSNELLPLFSCWGEEEYTTVKLKVGDASPSPAEALAKRRPDVVCYLTKKGPEAIDAVLELKLVLNAENPTASLEELKSQLKNARLLAPSARVIGLVFVAEAPGRAGFSSISNKIRREVERVMPDADGFSWVEGHDMTPIFRQVVTRYHYPSMSVSLGLGVRELSGGAGTDEASALGEQST